MNWAQNWACGAAIASLVMPFSTHATPAPAPCEGVQTEHGFIYFDPFIVFFDWDGVAIGPQAAAILDNVARAYADLRSHANLNECLIVITGHSDRSGSEAYNLRLSRRRAESVGAYLRRRGLTVEQRYEPFGETRPIVETADGAREPQNRRSEINIGPRNR